MSQAAKRLKKIVIIEKDCNHSKILWWFKVIVINWKYHDLKVLQKSMFQNKINLTRRIIKN